MNIAVLAGGISTEREVSIVSGTGVCKALREKGHRAILIDVFCGDERIDITDKEEVFPAQYDVNASAAYMRSMNGSIEAAKASGREFFGPNVLAVCKMADVVFLALHGADGEGGTVQAAFDLFRIPYTGSGPLGSAMAMDKGISRKLFRECGVPTAAGLSLKREEKRLSASENGVGLPCIVKPCCGGSSVGVAIAHTQEEFRAGVEESFRFEDKIFFEEYVKGGEILVAGVYGGEQPVI